MYLFVAVLSLHCCTGFSLVAASMGYSLAEVLRLLIVVASLVAEHGLQSTQASVVVAPGLQSTGSVVVAQSLSCSVACGIFLGLGSNPYLLHWQADSLPLSHQGSLSFQFLKLDFFFFYLKYLFLFLWPQNVLIVLLGFFSCNVQDL